MQNLDPSGQYTDAEVKAALSGVGGSRKWSFRYARLDSKNNYIEDIDYIQSCTINNDFLADIKRTAKFNILDSGRLNYLSDRIKPYVRLAMPADNRYSDAVSALQPDVWWKLDDAAVPAPVASSFTIPDGNTYNTRLSAYSSPSTGINNIQLSARTGSATARSEAWLAIQITTPDPLVINWSEFYPGGMNYEVYTAASTTDNLVKIFPNDVDSDVDVFNTESRTLNYAFPQQGYYYVRAFAMTSSAVSTTVSFSRGSRLEDSSNNHVNAVGLGLNLQTPPLVGSGGSWTYKNTPSLSGWEAQYVSMQTRGAIVVNYWLNATDQAYSCDFSFNTAKSATFSSTFRWTHNPGDPNFYFSLSLPNNYATMSVPSSKLLNGTHMVTYVYDPIKGVASVYVDAQYMGDFTDTTPLTNSATDFGAVPLVDITVQPTGNVDGSIILDDIVMVFQPVTQPTLAALYAAGTNATSNSNRPGYVEWPQGVFLLSSPKRTLTGGNVVTREVDAYDQLLVLKEDSFDTRFAFAAGTKYTMAIKKVLQSVYTLGPLTIDGSWATGAADPASQTSTTYAQPSYGSNQTNTTNSVSWNFPTTSAVQNGMYSKDVAATIDGFSISAKVAVSSLTLQAAVIVDVYDPTRMASGYNYIDFAVYNGNLVFSSMDKSTQLPYNAVTHAYVRMSESSGSLTFETSPDGTSWVTRWVTPSGAQSGSAIAITLSGQSTIAAGTASLTNIVMTARNGSALRLVESSATLPAAMEWEAGITKLQALNDLLAAINYESPWFDEDGVFRAKPYISPTVRPAEFTYATDASSVISGDVGQTVDLFKIPNKWTLVVSEPDRPVITSTFTNSNPTSPTSTIARGRIITDVRKEQTAVDQATLDARVARLAFEASQVYEAIEFETGLMPMHSNNDIYKLHIDGLSIDNKYSETAWSMDLDPGSAMSHTTRRITQV